MEEDVNVEDVSDKAESKDDRESSSGSESFFNSESSS